MLREYGESWDNLTWSIDKMCIAKTEHGEVDSVILKKIPATMCLQRKQVIDVRLAMFLKALKAAAGYNVKWLNGKRA